MELSDTQKAKIKNFLEDKIMRETIRDIITKSFLKPQSGDLERDVYMLAASRLAIDLLDEAFKDIARFGRVETKSNKEFTNPGL